MVIITTQLQRQDISTASRTSSIDTLFHNAAICLSSISHSCTNQSCVKSVAVRSIRHHLSTIP